jgi:hypothetical protein
LKYYFTKEGKLKKLILLFLFISNPAWSAELKIPPCFTDCTFDNASTGGLTANSVKTTTLEVYSTAIFEVSGEGDAVTITQKGGILGTDDLRLWHDGTNAWIRTLSGSIYNKPWTGSFGLGNNIGVKTTTLLNLNANAAIGWHPGTAQLSWESGNPDVELVRDSVGWIAVTDGSTGMGSLIASNIAFSSITTLTSSGDAPIPYHHFHCDATAGDVTFDIHSSASGPKGLIHNFLKIDNSANDCILDGAGGETFSGLTTITISTQWENLTIYTDQSNWFIE